MVCHETGYTWYALKYLDSFGVKATYEYIPGQEQHLAFLGTVTPLTAHRLLRKIILYPHIPQQISCLMLMTILYPADKPLRLGVIIRDVSSDRKQRHNVRNLL
jgi:hypothetical protein